MTSLPVVDISAFRADPTSNEAAAVVAGLLKACHEVGFVYITGHGVEPARDQDLFSAAHDFFALPLAERRALAIGNSPAFRGYTTLGDERTNGKVDWREQLDVGPEEAAPADLTGPPWHRLRGPNQWPANLPSLKPVVLDWMAEIEALGVTCLRALALGLGQPIDCFDHAFLPESDVHLKVIRYPEPDVSVTEQGLGAHHDTGVLTFIAQDGLGLQVETANGFVDAPPMPGAYIMNLGEMLQRSTSGYLKATPHRVVSPEDGERISVAFFFNPRFETVFEPIELPADLAQHAPGGEHQKIADPIHALFGENNLRTRLRSHPDVAANHYADLGS